MATTKEIKLLGVVITYNPDLSEVTKNISSYINHLETLIIWDNTPSKSFDINSFPESFRNKIICMGISQNVFISKALNEAVKYANQHDFTHILTMDQDSRFEAGHFSTYVDLVQQNLNEPFIFGPNYNFKEPTDNIVVNKHHLITSGQIVSLEILRKIGLYREDYEIDCVDYEFCYRAKKFGYSAKMVTTVLLHHEFGNLKKSKLGFFTSNYSTMRLYHIARNNIILKREYPDQVTYTEIFDRVIKHIFKIIIAENNKISKTITIFNGLFSGFRKRDLFNILHLEKNA